MKLHIRPYDAFLPALMVVTCMWLSGCGGLTPITDTDKANTGRSVPDDRTDSDGGTVSDGGTASDGGTGNDGGGNANGGLDTDNGSGGNTDSDGGSETGGGGGNGVVPVVFTWSLPPDPETPTLTDDVGYESLFRGDCEGAASLITRTPDSVPVYSSWTGPRAIVFTAAGVAFCRGDPATGKALTQQAIDQYGIGGLGPENTPWCRLYRELRSVIEQQPEDAFECSGIYAFDGPVFKTGVDANGQMVWDDPLTPEDETLPQFTPEPPPTSEPAETPVPETPVPETPMPGTPVPDPSASTPEPDPSAGTPEALGTWATESRGEEQHGE